VRAVPLKDTEGSVHGWVGMNTDVTERREAEEALRASDRRKDEFLAMLGHELRNPLAAIRSSVAVHSAAGDDPDLARRTWAVVDRQSVHMTRLVNDLLDIMRIDRGKLRLERTRVALGECITDVVTAMQPRADAAGLTLEVDLPAEPLYVNADAERVVQVLDNLLRNAVTYTDEGGRISIAARKHAARAVVTVRDTGIGIDPDQIDALFEPYRQGDGGRRHGGLGLGLTLIKRLVELHGGRVSAHSDGPGTGSEFQVELPLASPPPVTEPLALESLPPPRRVLVVDDEADVADMFAVMLAGLGQRVEVAHSGAEALEAVRRQAPDVAFLDLSMPSMSGAELALELRTRVPDNGMHLVALSGFSIDIRTTGREFDDHLLKPASVETILGLLNSL
jgi:two-component system CheB/CheR fusion protein